jgi:hypothetical protein
MSASGLPGKREDAMRAGMMMTGFIGLGSLIRQSGYARAAKHKCTKQARRPQGFVTAMDAWRTSCFIFCDASPQ